MSGLFSSIIASLVTIPLLGYIIVFVISKLITKHHRKSVKIAIDVTTFFLIIAVHYMIIAIWDLSFLWLILIILIIEAVIFVIVHWKTKHEIHLGKVFRGFWRLNFLLFSFAYIILLVYGLIMRINLAVSI